MSHELIVPVAQDVAHARSLAITGDRETAVYTAHERLEDDLAKLPVVMAETKKHSYSGVDPWVAVSTTIESICQEVELCLQLFSTGVKMQRFKGLRTVSTLYNQQNCPADRLRCFFDIVHAAFTVDGTKVPMSAVVLYKFTQTVRIFDVNQAVIWLKLGINNMLEARSILDSSEDSSSSTHMRLVQISVFVNEKNAIQRMKEKGKNSLMVSMLTLLIKCGAETGQAVTEVQERKSELGEFMKDDVFESLIQFESSYTKRMNGKKERIREKKDKRIGKGEIKKKEDVKTSISTNTSTVSRNNDPSRVEFSHRFLQYLLRGGWRQHPTKAIVALLAFILICVLAKRTISGLLSALKNIKSSSYGGRKTLTL
ncbi:uncharacterized protein TM35_000121150 [Trypanosoma theileri]|uniref:Uncharacterized protein n=1 Tax=Trypanosoma theileri TaxID=67003 RepID=A0A1X0NYW0_9TRYP|nr:uncharacterized protein TM35_000121150 [Trypanosoma theileri]ORC89340.1 hypothetical protein TM35_000121150 [Trypanosoma theileri]